MHSTEEDLNVTVINLLFFCYDVCCRSMLLASLHFGMRACCLVVTLCSECKAFKGCT